MFYVSFFCFLFFSTLSEILPKFCLYVLVKNCFKLFEMLFAQISVNSNLKLCSVDNQ